MTKSGKPFRFQDLALTTRFQNEEKLLRSSQGNEKEESEQRKSYMVAARLQLANAANSLLHDKAQNGLSLIDGLVSPPVTLVPLVRHPLRIQAAGARYFKIVTANMPAPLKIKLHPSGDLLLAPGKCATRPDCMVYWSYSNKYPIDGCDGECDGKFTKRQRMMTIQPYGLHQFPQEQIYLGIYTKSGLDYEVALGFGPKADARLHDLFSEAAKFEKPVAHTVEEAAELLKTVKSSASRFRLYQMQADLKI